VIIGFHARNGDIGDHEDNGDVIEVGVPSPKPPKSPSSPKSPSRSRIASAAQAVLDARAAHPNATLADLYDPLTMPPDLVKAHAHLDALVDKAYGLSPSCTDLGRVAHLFKLNAEKTAK
jgi:hypothetical protein